MEIAEIKKLLTASKKEPVNCGIGQAKDGAALIALHRNKAGRALVSELEKENPGMKMPCFGTASVDIDDDPKLVKLTLNKAPGGLGKRLKKSLKGTGFSKVMIMLEDGSVAESIAEEEEGESEGQQAGAAATTSTVPPGEPPISMASLRGDFANMMRQIPMTAAGNPELLEKFKALAAVANDALKGTDGNSALKAVGELRKALAAAPPPELQPSASAGAKPSIFPPGQFVAMQKSRLLWDAARKKVASEVSSLRSAVRAEFEGDPEETTAINALDQLDEVLNGYSEDLLDLLDDMLNETDATAYAESRKEATALLAEYVTFTESNPLVKKLDGDTPFGMKLSIASTMTATLKALQANLR